MNLDSELLEILACPACKSALRVDDPASELVCTDPECGYAYPVRDDIPVLLVDEARKPGDAGSAAAADPAASAAPDTADDTATDTATDAADDTAADAADGAAGEAGDSDGDGTDDRPDDQNDQNDKSDQNEKDGEARP